MRRQPGRLQERRVLVTRAEPPQGPLASALAARGARVLHWPVYRVVIARGLARRRWAAGLHRFDWLVFASAHAVDAVRAWGAPAVLDGQLRPRVAVVGAATAAAARAAGWRVALRAPESNGAALAAALIARGAAGASIALPASSLAGAELQTRLRRAGAKVQPIVAYRLRWSTRSPRRLRRECARGFDAVTFTSPSCVEGLERSLGATALRRLLAATTAVAIGASTGAALRRRSRRVPKVAAAASIPSLVRAVESGLKSRPRATAPRAAERRGVS